MPRIRRSLLIAARERAGLSQRELAKRMGMHRLAIVAIEVGRRNPSIETMAKWIEALGPHAHGDFRQLFRIDQLKRYRALVDLLDHQQPAA